jgi:hypothetical protein
MILSFARAIKPGGEMTMQRPNEPEWHVLEQHQNGLWDFQVHTSEDDAMAEADHMRRHNPGRRVMVYKLTPTLVKEWAATDIHPRPYAE